jgi:ParB-like chromosome segregation protein Spo0J
VAQIAASIKEWGWTNPVLIDEQNNIIAGHGRVMAAQVLAIETIPCVVAKGWTKQQRQAYVIADNKLALNAGWDDDMLKSEFEELQAGGFDLDLIGFTDEEMQSILQEVDFSPSDEDDQGRLDEVAPKLVTCPHCSHVFDMRKADED